ncbi:single-stranded-DNA-specific exonuclease RecJ [Hominiventricola filiformis]|uniref:Single-stranded-DNA-specific exonuclease RecJ n=1 Tax=Hominiventricola filiformis TaxID=2885352 RepID=A0AAE3A9D5_9FIRM|nr:single-stranded-DNA-specific exonuclease RecJ [Hominiventricola filiformis]MCC2126823.1 single-stranded-DNA-specific exonuclease RecJ [Hominiventricola filiformis]
MAKWVEIRKGADFRAIGEKYGISPFTARLIRNKDIVGDQEIEEYLHGTLEDLHPASLMKGIPEAVDLLEQKIGENAYIRIIGDYDIDGVCATYILLRGFRAAGARVDTDIPDRMKDGYGLNRELVKRAYDAGVDTIVTCDNGIAAVQEIAYARELGMTVIVTDHHEVQEELPSAQVIVNPRQADCPYPFKKLCGAAVAWKLVGAFWQQMGLPLDDLYDELLMFAGFATVGDVMDLTGENRILVREGLKRLQKTTHPGMSALIEANELARDTLSAFHIGFVLGPCINASGRLATAKRALALLDTKDQALAIERAAELKELNDERKELTEQGLAQAVDLIEHSDLMEDRVLVVYLPDCHESLAGIIAGRIRERYYRPVFVLTRAEDGVKGSGRSIETYSMFEEMSKCKELYTRYGGHPMAAGVSMPEEHVELFRRRLNELCTLSKEDLTEVVHIDMALPFSCVSEQVVKELSLLEPFGKANTKPVFAARNVRVLESRVLGKNQNVLRMKLMDESGMTLEGIYFNNCMQEVIADLQKKPTFHILYYPEINEFRGKRTLQLRVQGYC